MNSLDIFNIDKDIDEIKMTSPLVWAYIGDAVFELYIRLYLLNRSNSKPSKLHHESIKIVSAKGQADLLEKIIEKLSEEEKNIIRRGRNSKPKTIAKNASVKEYLKATGLEALIGYLFLNQSFERLKEILEMIKTEISKKEKK